MKQPRLPMDPANWSPEQWKAWKRWDRNMSPLYSPEMESEAQQLRRWYKKARKWFK